MRTRPIIPLLIIVAGFGTFSSLAESQTIGAVSSSSDVASSSPAGTTQPQLNLAYTRPTEKTKLRNYFFDAFGPYAIVGSAVSGGINQINSKYAIAVPEDGLNAAGEATQSYTITGLTNGTTYTVVVSAVDAFGNIGPPSNEACDYPAPVNDFWTLYRQAGGQAGGLCALEAVGAPASSTVAFGAIAAMVLSLVRRRRSRR